MTHKFNLLFLTSLLLIACADESPMESVYRDVSAAERQYAEDQEYQRERQEKQRQQQDDCYYGTSTKSASWCCSNFGYQCNTAKSSSSSYYNYYYSSSSYKSNNSSSTSYNYLTQYKTMKFTLTYYNQLTSAWDGVSAGGAYSDGDPTISFTIYFIASGGQSDSESTGTLLSLQDQGSWSGTATTTIFVPNGTQDIKVCPKVIDKDAFSNDDMSSGKCYTKTNIGKLANNSKVEQSDYNATKYDLEWEWYLY
ncbi:MAG: hypothetical protein II835_16650 [Fibrobacter sp.]|nr:hypothetical protein [Fibrobacter sp.]